MKPAASSFILRKRISSNVSPHNRHADKAPKKYWKNATQTEGLVLIFLYFAAYLTGIGALLERLRPSDDAIPLNVDDLNAANATALASDDAANESNPIAVQVVYWVLLAFYSLVPVAGCAWFWFRQDQIEHR